MDGDARGRARHAPHGLHGRRRLAQGAPADGRGGRIPDEIAPNGSRLALPWQWNHAPDNRYWSLTDRDGWLRLTTGKVRHRQYIKHLKLANDDEAA